MSQKDTAVHGDKPLIASSSGRRDHKELSAVAFERTRMPMVLSDVREPDCPIILANRAFLDLTGYGPDEVLGRNCRFLQGPATSQAALAEVRIAIAEKRGADVELLNYRKDGTSFWNQLHLSPIFDDDGSLAYYFASQIDVTEYRRVQSLEASEHRLLLEVNHRTKNALAIVESIVRLSNPNDAGQYAAAIQGRVQALSQAHALLSDANWQAIGLHQIVEIQTRRYGTSRISLNGPAIAIAPETVQPLSLIFHEMASNAAVHGAISRNVGGKVAIYWDKIPDGGGARLMWSETGTANDDGNPRPGFGITVTDALILKQLGGQISRKWREDGLKIVIDLPATCLVSDS